MKDFGGYTEIADESPGSGWEEKGKTGEGQGIWVFTLDPVTIACVVCGEMYEWRREKDRCPVCRTGEPDGL